MAKLEKLAVKTRMFDGLARIVMFPDYDLDTMTEETKLSDIFATGGVDLGEIVEGSPSWDGDDVETNILKNTEGGAIRTRVTAGTCAWSCRIPLSKETAERIGSKLHTETTLGDGSFKLATGKEVIGMNPTGMMKQCPIGVLNLARDEFALFPKGNISFAITIEDDDLWELSVKATADDVETPNLDTLMFVPLSGDPFEEGTAVGG